MNHARHLLHYVRRSAAAEAGSDGQLLQRFLDRRDEEAFAALLARHGAMVWSLCLRVLGNAADAEDAFQATFLVLVRKAGSVRPRDRVGNWLYGVAHNAALKLREGQRRRRTREARAAAQPPPLPPDPELAEVLDAEVSRLPDKYRAAVVACDLEGKTRAEAARHLGWPEGTVAGRLARARELLARRLARHGLAGAALPPAAGMPAALATGTGRAAVAVAAGLSSAEVSPRALSLMQGVLKTMYLSQLKGITTWAALLLAVGLGVGAAARPGRDGGKGAPPATAEKGKAPAKAAAKPAATPEEELARLAGTWKFVSGTVTLQGVNGITATREFTPAERRGYVLTIEADGALTFRKGGVGVGLPMGPRLKFVVSVKPGQSPAQINLYPLGSDEDRCFRGVYRLDGDRLELACYDSWDNEKPPPSIGTIELASGRYLVLERVKGGIPDEAKKADAVSPSGPGAEYQKRLAGTWRVDAATRGGTKRSAWERLGMRFDFAADGRLTVYSGGRVAPEEFVCRLDVEQELGALVLSSTARKVPVRAACHFLGEGQVVLKIDPTANLPEVTYVLSRYRSQMRGTDQPLGLRVTPSDAATAKRLAGTWRLDAQLTKWLAGKEAGSHDPKLVVAIDCDPAVAAQVPDAFRELLADKKVYLSGRLMTTVEGTRNPAKPFVLIEHEGAPVLVCFEKTPEGDWVDVNLVSVAVVNGVERDADLLFLTSTGQRYAMGFRRAKAD